ncbi:CBN-BATH-25 protein [Aphelenchoides avenae]|nr:CBN-BATH-25 protein [Aphelenchus avenae]
MKRANEESQADGPAEKRSSDGATYHPSQKARLELFIDNLSGYMGEDEDDAPAGVEGCAVFGGGLQWSLSSQVEDNSLGVYLRCMGTRAGWSLMTDYTVRVVGSSVQKVERGVDMCESSEDLCVFSEEKEALLDPANNYITDGAFKMEVDVTIYEPYRMLVDFFTADSNYDADVALRVQDRSFHVNKAYLGHESAFFYKKFFGPLADDDPLQEVTPNGFLQFLGAIHRMRAPITDENAEILIKLADRFQVLWLFRDCEAYLLGSSGFAIVDKLIVSMEVGANKLKKQCLDELTLEDVDTLVDMAKKSPKGAKLDGCLLLNLLDKQKELMESKHERVVSRLNANMCWPCRMKPL